MNPNELPVADVANVPHTPAPTTDQDAYSIQNLINVLEQRLKEEQKLTEVNKQNISNLSKIVSSLKTIPTTGEAAC